MNASIKCNNYKALVNSKIGKTLYIDILKKENNQEPNYIYRSKWETPLITTELPRKSSSAYKVCKDLLF